MSADGRDALRAKWARAISGAGGKSPTNAAAQLELFKAAALEYGQSIGNGLLRNDAADDLYAIAVANGLDIEFGHGEIQQTIVDGFHAAATAKPKAKANGAAAPPGKLQWLDMLPWDSVPVPERKWAIRDRVPLNQAGLFSGEGGTGKSIIELMKDVAHVAGKDWLGSMPEQGPAIYLGAEDEADELHRRLAAIASPLWRHLQGTDRRRAACALSARPGRHAVRSRQERPGRGHRPLPATLTRLPATSSRRTSASTRSRAPSPATRSIVRQVYAFAMHMQALAMAAGGSVTILSHPSLAGINTGTGLSGSTAWHGAFRFRQYLKSAKAEPGEQPDDDIRELEFKKNQYGPAGGSIVLRYERGLFLPVAGPGNLERLAREQHIGDLFLELLDRSRKHKAAQQATRKPQITMRQDRFAKDQDAKADKVTRAEFAQAMERLFAAGKIHIVPYGHPSRGGQNWSGNDCTAHCTAPCTALYRPPLPDCAASPLIPPSTAVQGVPPRPQGRRRYTDALRLDEGKERGHFRKIYCAIAQGCPKPWRKSYENKRKTPRPPTQVRSSGHLADG